MTNLIASAVLATNLLVSVSPSQRELKLTETVVATVAVPGWTTNTVMRSTNEMYFALTNAPNYVWVELNLKQARNPLAIQDRPPLPPGMTMTNKP